MEDITYNNSLEVHESWLLEVTQAMNNKYGSMQGMYDNVDAHAGSIFWFFRASGVVKADFETICKALEFDSEQVQIDKG